VTRGKNERPRASKPAGPLAGLSGPDALRVALASVPRPKASLFATLKSLFAPMKSLFAPLKRETAWRRRARRALFWIVLLQLVLVVAFIGVLVIGERSRATLIALYLPRQPLLVATVGCALLAPFIRRGPRVTLGLMGVQSILALVVFFPVMGFSTGATERGLKPIRIASYNIYFGRLGPERLVDEIVAMTDRMDIIVLQASFVSFAEMAKERLKEGWDVRQEKEFVLLTHFKVQKAELGPTLPGTDQAPSMYMRSVLDTPQGTLRVFNVHPYSARHALFDAKETPTNIDRRDEQIAAAVTAARSDPPPFVLIGDTNLPAMSGIGRRSFAGLKDAFEETGFGFGYTFPATRPWMRIDRALGHGIRFLAAEVGPTGHSDHRPIFVRFELEPPDL
jgi:endonuclease/exonuclease/phosphatase family metal-dependent hydrolase